MSDENEVNILLVDDKKENLLSLQVVLEREGYSFVEATSGKEALRILLKQQDFAIILMDVQMPLMDGFETAEMIRQSDRLKHVPIIFLTADMGSSEYVFKGYQAGAVDYMIKPLSPEILKAKVAVFVDLYLKNKELSRKEKQLKGLNQAIIETNKQLQSRNEEIEKRAEELKVVNKELEAFTYVSSHDLQEPLRKIQTFVGILMDNEYQNLSDKGKYNFNRIGKAAERMQQLIESLLAFSKTNATERKFEKISLKDMVEEIKNEFKDQITEKEVVIETPELCEVSIIPFQFFQLLENLTSNSFKFARQEVPLKITISGRIVKSAEVTNANLPAEKQYCHIVYKDNGIGFEPQFNEKIFEVFQKLHSRDAYEGTGIGLAIVKKIVDNHNGYVKASGELMKGATFEIFIPHAELVN